MKKILIILFIVSFLTSFGQNENFPSQHSKLSKTSYTNDFFEIEIPISDKWHIQNKDEIKNMHNEKSGSGSTYASSVLLSMFKYKKQKRNKINYNFSLVYEKKQGSITSMTESLIELLEKQSFNIINVEPVQINETNFTAIKTNISDIKQDYLLIEKRGYFISFIFTYSTNEEKQQVYYFLENMKFNE